MFEMNLKEWIGEKSVLGRETTVKMTVPLGGGIAVS